MVAYHFLSASGHRPGHSLPLLLDGPLRLRQLLRRRLPLRATPRLPKDPGAELPGGLQPREHHLQLQPAEGRHGQEALCLRPQSGQYSRAKTAIATTAGTIAAAQAAKVATTTAIACKTAKAPTASPTTKTASTAAAIGTNTAAEKKEGRIDNFIFFKKILTTALILISTRR